MLKTGQDLEFFFEDFLTPPLLKSLLQWQDELVFERQLSPHTVKNYFHDLKAFFLFLRGNQGNGPLTQNMLQSLEARDFRAFLAHRLSQGVSLRTNARALSTLKTFYRFQKERHNLTNELIQRLKSPRLKKTLPRPLSENKAIAVTETAPLENKHHETDLRDQLLFTLLYAAGLRLSEALSLNIEDLTAETRYLKIMGKGKKERLIPLLAIVRDRLTPYLKTHPQKGTASAPLFCGVRGGRLSPTTAQLQMRRLRNLLGLPETATPHSLRHSFASHLLQSGGDLRTLQDLLGHESLSTTQRYTEIETSSLLNAYQKAHPLALKEGPIESEEGPIESDEK